MVNDRFTHHNITNQAYYAKRMNASYFHNRLLDGSLISNKVSPNRNLPEITKKGMGNMRRDRGNKLIAENLQFTERKGDLEGNERPKFEIGTRHCS